MEDVFRATLPKGDSALSFASFMFPGLARCLAFVLAITAVLLPEVRAEVENDTAVYVASATESQKAALNHIRSGCPGPQYGQGVADLGMTTRIDVPRDFSCEVMRFDSTALEWSRVNELIAELPVGQGDPETVVLLNTPQFQARLEGTAQYSGGDETHTFFVKTFLESPGVSACQNKEDSERWTTTSSGSRKMSVEVDCAIGALEVVPDSIHKRDGKISSFRAKLVLKAELQAAHDVLYGFPGWRGGIYEITVDIPFLFTPENDSIYISDTTPFSEEPLEPGSMQGFEATVDYNLLTETEGEIQLDMYETNEGAVVGQSDPIPVTRGSGSVTLSIPAFKLPESGELWLYATLYDKGRRETLVESDPRKFKITNDIIIDHIETVQAVQHRDNSIPLVAGKVTIIRVFPRLKHKTRERMVEVPATVRLYCDGVETPTSPLLDDGLETGITYGVNRRDSAGSYNWFLLAEASCSGTLTIKTTVNPDRTAKELDYENNEASLTAHFNDRPGLNIRYMRVCLQNKVGQVCPSTNVGSLPFWMSQLYPISLKQLSVKPALTVQATWDGPELTSEAAHRELITDLQRLYESDLASGAGPMDQLVAWVPYTPGMPATGFSDPPWDNGKGRVAWIADTTHLSSEIWDWTLAHEIAHNMGLHHPPTTDANAPSEASDWPYTDARTNEHGWYFLDVMPGLPVNWADTKYDFMAYRNPAQLWISPHHYLKLYNSGFVPSANPSGTVPGVAGAQFPERRRVNGVEDLAIVSGAIGRGGGSAEFDPILRIRSDVGPGESNASGEFCLQFQDTSGVASSDHCFDLSFRSYRSQASLDSQTFVERLGVPESAARLVLLRGDQELASVVASPSAPAVEITAPAAGAQWEGSSQSTVTWTATDPDGDSLAYSLLYSADGGDTWRTMGIDLAVNQFAVDPAQIEGGSQVHFRVAATDGFHTATAEVGPITVVQNPEIEVDGPIDAGTIFAGGEVAASFSVRNSGTGPLTLSSIVSDNPAFTLDAVSLPAVIPAAAALEVQVRHAPIQEGESAGTLTFTSDATANPSLGVTIQGTATDGQTPAIGVRREPVVFLGVPAGDVRDIPVEVENRSHVELDVAWTLSGDGFAAVSTESSSKLAAHDSSLIIVQFAPENPGEHTGQLTITSDDPDNGQIVVELLGVAHWEPERPAINYGGVVDAARGRNVVVPGGIASIYGQAFSDQLEQASATPLPLSMRGIEVLVNGEEAPLYFVAPYQINFQVPFEAPASGNLNVTVLRNGQASYASLVPSAPFAPAMFMNFVTGEPIIQRHSDGSLITAANPAVAGEILTLYMTGIGSVTNPPETGQPTPVDPLPVATQMPVVTAGGADAIVHYAGLSPHFVGLAIINVGLPATLPAGSSLPLVISFGESATEEVSLPVTQAVGP